MTLEREAGMMDATRVHGDGCGLFSCFKVPEMFECAAYAYVGAPVPISFEERYADRPGCAVNAARSEILHVHLMGHISEICESVVVSDAVDVVKPMLGPRSCDMEPREAVRLECPIVNADGDVSEPIEVACHIADTRVFGTLDSSRENARLRIVVQQFAQSLRGKIGLSHEAVLSLIGQRLAGVSSATRASLFSRGNAARAMGQQP